MFRRHRAPVRHLVVGLGNPGPEYAGTRHNVGFMVVELLSQRHRIPIKVSQSGARVGEGMIAGEPVALVKPLTFMNLSGRAVAPLMNRHSLPPGDLIVVYDDADLPVGRIRLRVRGSAGGHGGLKSIIASLGSSDFPRVRIGIGRSAGGDLIDHVLSRFAAGEREMVERAVERAADAVEHVLTQGIEPAMNRFNAAEAKETEEPPDHGQG
jgi:peptidyl-tRNA hydrolase, PTH1 family